MLLKGVYPSDDPRLTKCAIIDWGKLGSGIYQAMRNVISAANAQSLATGVPKRIVTRAKTKKIDKDKTTYNFLRLLYAI